MGATRKDNLPSKNVIDLSDAFIVENPQNTPLTTLLFSRGKNYSHTDKTKNVTLKVKKLSEKSSGGRFELEDAPDAERTIYSYVDNTLEIFSKNAIVTGSAAGVGDKDELMQAEIKDRVSEIKLDVEKQMIAGTRVEEETAETGRKMDGLMNLVSDENIIDAETNELTEDHILDALDTMFKAGKTSGELFLLCNSSTKRKINEIYKKEVNTSINLEIGQGDAGIVIDRILTDFGNINILMSAHVKEDNLLIFNIDPMKVPEYRPITYTELSQTGDYYKGMVVTETGILTHPKALAKVVNFTI